MTAEKTVEQTRADYLAECVEAVAQRLRRLDRDRLTGATDVSDR